MVDEYLYKSLCYFFDMKEWFSISSKIRKETHAQLLNFCENEGITPSTHIRNLIETSFSEIIPINKAGVIEFEYDKKGDHFKWVIKYDDGSKKEIAENLSLSFLENLKKAIIFSLSLREDYIKKKEKESFTIPSKIKKLEGGGEYVKG